MTHPLLISTNVLAEQLDNPDWVIVDCRFALNDTEKGRQEYEASHIPGAVYAHLDADLSGPVGDGALGRHPLPSVAVCAERFSAMGIDAETQVIVYDSMSGVIAGRLWWMLRWLGHDKVAVLDGDWRRWSSQARPTRSGIEQNARKRFVPAERPEMQVSVDEVLNNLENDEFVLVDVRDEARYRGESAGMDPLAGHIPGAASGYYAHNLNADGTYKSADELRAHYIDLLGDPDSDEVPEDIVFYCGSGVSASHDLIAMELAGLGAHRLYVGSWSGWSSDETRPVETGMSEA